MGSPKALLRVGERTLLERAISAAGKHRTALVLPSALAAQVPRLPASMRVVFNDEPQHGMSRSLALANAALGCPEAPLIVLLVDTPLVDATLVERIVRGLGPSDVAYPVRDGRPGHPVVFGPRARSRIAELGAGDTLRDLRDDPALQRSPVGIDDDAPFADVDTPQDLERMGGA